MEKLKLSEIHFANNKGSTGVDSTPSAPSEKSGGNLSIEPEKMYLLKKLRIAGPEEEVTPYNKELDDQIDEESETTDRLLDGNLKSTRSKLRKKQPFKINPKITKRSIFKETISTKVKKQEKFNVHLEHENGWNRNNPG
jgi:hypothetical protein